MTWLDLILLAILLFFVLTGLIRGFIKQLFGKVSVVGGIFFAIIFTPFLEQKFILLVKNEILSKILSFILIFIIVFLALKIVQHILHKIFTASILKSLDRLLGFVLGFLEGIVILYFLIVALQVMPFWDNISSYFEESFIYNIFDSLLNKKQENASENFALLWQMKNNYQNI